MGENKTELREWTQEVKHWWLGRGLGRRDISSKATLHDDGTLWVGHEPGSTIRINPGETAELIRLLTDHRIVGKMVYGNPVREALEGLHEDIRETYFLEQQAAKEMTSR